MECFWAQKDRAYGDNGFSDYTYDFRSMYFATKESMAQPTTEESEERSATEESVQSITDESEVMENQVSTENLDFQIDDTKQSNSYDYEEERKKNRFIGYDGKADITGEIKDLSEYNGSDGSYSSSAFEIENMELIEDSIHFNVDNTVSGGQGTTEMTIPMASDCHFGRCGTDLRGTNSTYDELKKVVEGVRAEYEPGMGFEFDLTLVMIVENGELISFYSMSD